MRTYPMRCDAIVLEAARFSRQEKKNERIFTDLSREWNIISALTRESFAIVVARDNWPLMYFLTVPSNVTVKCTSHVLLTNRLGLDSRTPFHILFRQNARLKLLGTRRCRAEIFSRITDQCERTLEVERVISD